MSVWRIGHRGACGHAPENTLASIEKALAFGVDGFEFDIQLSKDGEPMVIHDDTLERTTNGTGLVADYTMAELQQFDAGQGKAENQTIPSLKDVIALVDKRCRLFIELKAEHSTVPVVEQITHSVLEQGWDYDQFYICSFDHLQLLSVRTMNTRIRTCALFAGIPVTLAAMAIDAGAWSINPCIHHISQRLVDDAHRRGLKVLTWTVNRPEHIEKAHRLGVDGIFSDFPDLL
jgi:glycerophosphoryl diester phosphodiesterase